MSDNNQERESEEKEGNSKSSCPISVVVHGYIDQVTTNINPLNWQNVSETTDDVKVTFAWSNLSVSTYETRSGTCCGLRSGTVVPPKQILNNVSGIARPGEVLAIMGASGAGKTTLLNSLLFIKSEKLNITGARITNGKTATPSNITALSAYVQQEDLFIPSLTVKEHLMFQAKLSLNLSNKERQERVNEVMNQVGLTKVADVMIGGEKIKGISGGEKKRLSFASAVLTNPSILFCDEPTSGLDSFMAASIMDLINDLARSGKTIICTIHQPSSQIFSRLDKLLLLAEGETAYFGKASEAKKYFTSINFPCPEDYNPSDYFIQTLAIVPGKEIECREQVKNICDKFSESQLATELRSDVKVQEDLVENEEKAAGKGWDWKTKMMGEGNVYKASWWTQFSALVWRQTINMLRDPMFARAKIISGIVVGIILGVLYVDTELNQAGIRNLTGAVFIIVTNLSFGSIFNICNSFCSEIPVFLREHYNGMYRTDAYFLAKQMVEMPLFVLDGFIIFTIIYWMAGLNPAVDRYFIAMGIVALILQVVFSLGYFLSCAAPNVDISLAIAPVIIIPMMMFGGFYVNSGTIPVWLAWIKYVSWFFYGYNALMINQWSGIDNIECEGFQNADNSTMATLTGEEQAPVQCYTKGSDVLKGELDIDEVGKCYCKVLL